MKWNLRKHKTECSKGDLEWKIIFLLQLKAHAHKNRKRKKIKYSQELEKLPNSDQPKWEKV